jgi:XapX domain-containing protein
VSAFVIGYLSAVNLSGVIMKAYLLSLAIGILVGVLYSLAGVKSPAPPVIALVGLFGILGGEQLIPWIRTMMG